MAVDPNDPEVLFVGKAKIGEVFRFTGLWEPFPVPVNFTEITDEEQWNIGDVQDLEVDSASRVYVAANNGLWRWDGVDWMTFVELPTLDITALAIDRTADPEVVYVGTGGSGVFASQDAGASWERLNDGLEALSITKLTLSNSEPAALYAGTAYGAGAGVQG